MHIYICIDNREMKQRGTEGRKVMIETTKLIKVRGLEGKRVGWQDTYKLI